MVFADWFLSRSNAFKIFLNKFKIHKVNTSNSFRKVKRDNKLIVEKLRDHEDKIMELEGILHQLYIENKEPIKVYKKSK